MRMLPIYTVDELYKAFISHENKQPARRIAHFHAPKPKAEGYTAPKTLHPSEPPKVGRAFSINRKKGPEEQKRHNRRVAREKAAERRSDVEAYGRPME